MGKLAMVVVAALSVGMVGCGAARQGRPVTTVRRGDFTGELALTGAPADSWRRAEDTMIEHCGGRVRIVDADEAAQLFARDTAIGKTDQAEALGVEGERLYYVCVTRAEAAR